MGRNGRLNGGKLSRYDGYYKSQENVFCLYITRVWGSGLVTIFSRGNRGVCTAWTIDGCLLNLLRCALWCGYQYKNVGNTGFITDI